MVRVSRDLGFVLFVDDTNIFAERRDPVELFGRVNGGLWELDRWFRCNRLTLNLKKPKYSKPSVYGISRDGLNFSHRLRIP